MVQKNIPSTIDEYISTFPQEVQLLLQLMRSTIKKTAPEATEIISYQMPTFYYHGNLVHFAAYKHHIGFYPSPSGILKFEKELKKYKYSKGAIQFPINQELPLDIIIQIVKFRMHENETKMLSKKKS